MNKATILARIERIEFLYGEADKSEMNDIVEAIEQLDNPREIIPDIIAWFEEHPDEDVGSPGPFVHFVEEDDDYLEI